MGGQTNLGQHSSLGSNRGSTLGAVPFPVPWEGGGGGCHLGLGELGSAGLKALQRCDGFSLPER